MKKMIAFGRLKNCEFRGIYFRDLIIDRELHGLILAIVRFERSQAKVVMK